MGKRKIWTQDEIALARPYLKNRLLSLIYPSDFNIQLNRSAAHGLVQALYEINDSDGINDWANRNLTSIGWSRLLNFLRVKSHRSTEQAKPEETRDEDKDDREARKAALDYMAGLSLEERDVFMKALDEKIKRRARHRRQQEKEEARAEQEKRERAYRHQQNRKAVFTVLECRRGMQKHHPDKGGDAALFQIWKGRYDQVKLQERSAA